LPHLCAYCLVILEVPTFVSPEGLYRLMAMIIVITQNGKLLNLHSGLYIPMQKAESPNTSHRVFGRTVNNKSLVSETPYSVERQLNCYKVRNEGDDDNNLQSY
jgi:hypothetical protein